MTRLRPPAILRFPMAARKRADPATKTGYRAFCGLAKPDDGRVAAILDLLDESYPDLGTALAHQDPFQLLVATILSAQCTDAVVNQVTPSLFARYADADALSRADPEDVERVIRPTGFFRNKARNIIAAADIIDREHGGTLPRDIDALTRLPGVARKTANVVLGTAFGIAEGVAVDTHVMRVTRRWRMHELKDPKKIERCLQAILPRDRWIDFSHQTIWHGRRLCMARRPRCEECPFLPHCPEGKERVHTGPADS